MDFVALTHLFLFNQQLLATHHQDNLLNSDTLTNTFDTTNRLINATNSLTPIYNGVNNRVGQTVGVSTTNYALDVVAGLPEVIYTSQSEIYLHLPGVIVTQKATEVRYLLSDGLGSIRQAVDETGAVVAYHEFDPYGYTGEWWEDAVSLLHLRARWYDPQIGTFLSADPFEGIPTYPVTMNGYNYTHQNPINLTDPSGMSPFTACMQMPMCPALLASGGVIAGVTVGPVIATTTVIVAVPAGLGIIRYYACRSNGCIAQLPYDPIPAPEAEPTTTSPPVIKTPEACYWSADGCKPVSAIPTTQPNPSENPEPKPSRTPIRVPTPPDPCDGCDPDAFASWWETLPLVGAVRPGVDWYDYEQQVARGPGTMGGVQPRRVPAGARFIDVDGANPMTCMLLEAKYVRDPRNTLFSTEKPPFLHRDLVNEFERYYDAVTIPNGVAGAQPQGLTIITNEASTRPFFEGMLQSVGFSISLNGFVSVYP